MIVHPALFHSGTRWSGKKNFSGAELFKNSELPLPKGNALDFDERFVASHAARFAASQENGAEIRRHVIASDAKFAAPTFSQPSVRICARKPPCL